jgi:hypothetical protein
MIIFNFKPEKLTFIISIRIMLAIPSVESCHRMDEMLAKSSSMVFRRPGL